LAFLKYFTVTLFAFFASLPAHAQNLKLTPGFWQGINKDNFEYNVLEIKENGEHRLIIANIASAFHRNKSIAFNDNDIKCNRINCTIKLISPNKEHLQFTLILSRYLDNSFEVLEIYSNADDDFVMSKTYRLEKQERQSTVHTFIDKYRSRIDELAAIEKSGLYGFWVGLLNLDGNQKLVSIEFHPNKESYFTYFASGTNDIISTTFMPQDIQEIDNVLKITTSNSTFANKLIIHKDNRELKGYMYSNHKGTTLQTGSFKLYRFERPE
jgi:hypothetical protein